MGRQAPSCFSVTLTLGSLFSAFLLLVAPEEQAFNTFPAHTFQQFWFPLVLAVLISWGKPGPTAQLVRSVGSFSAAGPDPADFFDFLRFMLARGSTERIRTVLWPSDFQMSPGKDPHEQW